MVNGSADSLDKHPAMVTDIIPRPNQGLYQSPDAHSEMVIDESVVWLLSSTWPTGLDWTENERRFFPPHPEGICFFLFV